VDQEQQSRWRPTKRQLLWAVGIVAVLTVAVFIGYRYDITLWDWIKILIVPAAIAIGVAWLNRAQEREREAQEAHREREREATEGAHREREREAQAAQRERELAVENQRAQDAALQAYLDHMSQLLLDKDRPLREAKEDNEVRTLARARTLTVLSRLDADRKVTVLQFLYESGLITEDGGIVVLRGADLSGIVLSGAGLSEAKLSGAVLTGAKLSNVSLSNADLRGTDLRRADLQGANLFGANLRPLDPVPVSSYPPVPKMGQAADLSEANLKRAILVGADLTGAHLNGADLNRAQVLNPSAEFPPVLQLFAGFFSFIHGPENLLSQHRSLFLEFENLFLEYMASSLKGATMPTGQKYEDWLKAPGTDKLLKKLEEARIKMIERGISDPH
jgi:hypothetical protein